MAAKDLHPDKIRFAKSFGRNDLREGRRFGRRGFLKATVFWIQKPAQFKKIVARSMLVDKTIFFALFGVQRAGIGYTGIMNNNRYSRADKLEWLKQSCSPNFIQNHLALEMANWMGEREFEAFYDTLVRVWDIQREPADPNYDPDRDQPSE